MRRGRRRGLSSVTVIYTINGHPAGEREERLYMDRFGYARKLGQKFKADGHVVRVDVVKPGVEFRA